MRNTLSKTKSTLPDTTKWNSLNWLHIKRYVEKLQQRIYRAESLGNNRKVRELQRLLMRSNSALLVSIKRITQMNKGKKTAGVSKRAFNQMDRHVFYVTYHFLKKMHSKKAKKWIRQRYYRKDYRNISKDKWILSSPKMEKLQLTPNVLQLSKLFGVTTDFL